MTPNSRCLGKLNEYARLFAYRSRIISGRQHHDVARAELLLGTVVVAPEVDLGRLLARLRNSIQHYKMLGGHLSHGQAFLLVPGSLAEILCTLLDMDVREHALSEARGIEITLTLGTSFPPMRLKISQK